MTGYTQIDHLLDWANTFDPSLLLSEDDVETKFVLPFFRCLGYPEEYRRGKYPVNEYQSGKSGRKKEADHIYFSISEPRKQNADTALVLVEAKRSQAHNLEDAVIQANHYAEHLRPLFLVVTDGYHLKVLKRHRYHGNEVVFDITIHELRDRNTARSVYNQLQFETVKRLKEQAIDPLTHARYVEIMQLLDRYPDIQVELAKGDFEPSTKQEGRQLTVKKPKVAITCELPIAFEEGHCSITFSNIMLRGLTCHLSHAEILTDLMIGLDTLPGWETRCFLQQTEQNTFEARLGQTRVILSKDEADELCDAVDEVCQKYKNILVKTTDTLETWDFQPVSVEDERGFELLSVEQWLWDLMRQFAHEFDYDNGNSDWHIFDSQSWGIRVSRKGNPDHVVILPKFGSNFSPSTQVDLIYVDCITYLHLYQDIPTTSIFKDVGPHGVWTATYTKQWIEQSFIPKVLSYDSANRPSKGGTKTRSSILRTFPFFKLGQKQLHAIMQEAIQDYSTKEYIPLADINEPNQFSPYLHQIQSLSHHYHYYGIYNIPVLLLRPYYAAFTELARCTDPTKVDLHYIRENLGAVRVRTEQADEDNSLPSLSTYSDIVSFLDRQVARINVADYENCKVVDYLSCAFITIVEQGTFHFQQSQINAAKEALYPLLEQCRFIQHFIDPIILTPAR